MQLISINPDATNTALHAIHTGEEQIGVQNMFEANFIKDLKGPDGKLFVDRGDKICLAFSMHMDFFNPNCITQRTLDPSIQYLSEYLYVATIIPGPHEPLNDEMDHFVWPVVEQFVKAWQPGLRVSRTAASESGAVVEVGILLSVNDLLAARKVAGFLGVSSGFICTVCQLRGKTGTFNMDHAQWIPRSRDELRHWSTAYRDDPTRMLVIDAMHCILEGIVHYHCHHVLCLDVSMHQVSADGFKYAFEWLWIPYDHEVTPQDFRLDTPKHVPNIAKIQDALGFVIEGDKSMSLDQVWTHLNNRGILKALKFVAWTLELSTTLNDIHPTVSVERTNSKSKKKKSHKDMHFPTGKLASKKSHFIALLLNWQPHSSVGYVLPTGTPETLAHIQKVIQDTVRPSWVNSVPKNFGNASAGLIKADEWRTLSTVFLPIALITLWGNIDGCTPPDDESELGYLLKVLDHTMALFQATILACCHLVTASRAFAFRQCISTQLVH
ncbi:hypothetical protein BT96DRAFT_1004306 [Gymnopus androsaceus JB14]|uniref:Uncharacterized protein n=1 Tax=Gymnopus androsaceus JB14 TaxID=1447944 RepID=A0A6A4GRD8_9AGAR|nr:hypothetical protein BT96DRAFT_1004306 [Gymnopus androsaceus JB14]